MSEQATPTSDTPLSADSQHLLKEAYIAKSAKFNGFFDSFASEYKLLKVISFWTCQMFAVISLRNFLKTLIMYFNSPNIQEHSWDMLFSFSSMNKHQTH